MQGLTRHFKDPLTLLLWMLVAMSLLGTWQYAKVAPGIDYYVAWVAADAVKNDTQHNIYDPASKYKLAVEYRNKADAMEDAPRQKDIAQRRRELPMTATPFMYWVTGLVTRGEYESDFDNWHAISILTLTLSILLICRVLGYSTATSLAFLLPMLVWFSPHHGDLRVGNVNSIQLGLIALTLWQLSRGSDKRHLFNAGIIVGLMVMFKPNLAPIAMLFAGGYAFRQQYLNLGIAVSGMVTGLVTAFVVSSWWMGSFTAWFDWLKLISKTMEDFGQSAGSSTGVTGMTGITGVTSSIGQLSIAVILSVLVLVCLWWGRWKDSATTETGKNKDREIMENSLLVAMGCLVMMMASALVWLHYYLLTIPMFIMVLRPWQRTAQMNIFHVLMLRVLPAVALLGLMDSAAIDLFELRGRKEYWTTVKTISVLIPFVVGLWQLAFGINGQYQKVTGEPAAR